MILLKVCKMFCFLSGPYAKGDHVCRSVNEPLNVTCTLSQDAISNGFSSSGLMFVLYTWNENFDTVFFQFTNETVQKVINESTVELLIPRIPGYINNVHLDCKLHLNVTTSDIPSTTHTYRLLIAGEYVHFLYIAVFQCRTAVGNKDFLLSDMIVLAVC